MNKVQAAKGQQAVDLVDESDWDSAFHGFSDLGPLEEDGGALDKAYTKTLTLPEIKKIRMIHHNTYEISPKFEQIIKEDPVLLFESKGILYAEDGQHRINYLVLHEGKTELNSLNVVIVPLSESDLEWLDEEGIFRLDPNQKAAGSEKISIEAPPHWVQAAEGDSFSAWVLPGTATKNGKRIAVFNTNHAVKKPGEDEGKFMEQNFGLLRVPDGKGGFHYGFVHQGVEDFILANSTYEERNKAKLQSIKSTDKRKYYLVDHNGGEYP